MKTEKVDDSNHLYYDKNKFLNQRRAGGTDSGAAHGQTRQVETRIAEKLLNKRSNIGAR